MKMTAEDGEIKEIKITLDELENVEKLARKHNLEGAELIHVLTKRIEEKGIGDDSDEEICDEDCEETDCENKYECIGEWANLTLNAVKALRSLIQEDDIAEKIDEACGEDIAEACDKGLRRVIPALAVIAGAFGAVEGKDDD